MRQFIFAVIGCGMAVLLYFVLKPFFGVETLSWMCMLGAAPFIACGFVTYNGMTAEQFAWAWLKSKFIEPVKVKFECDTLYSAVMEKSKKEEIIEKLNGLVQLFKYEGMNSKNLEGSLETLTNNSVEK